ncbi:hypothetical protein ACFYOV_03530 [Streptomyces sp. NPDC005931]|uniref:hypothetical protein n=1 Tax=Streptomyces sp. NPDC005931 TaxID=3364737 RepID=UPI00369DD567
MGNARTSLLTAAAAATLLTVSGCSGEGAPAAEASPSGLAQYTAAPDPATPEPSPTTDAPVECVKTAGMGVRQLTAYLKELPSGSGAFRSRGLTLDSSGLRFSPEAVQRPCEAIAVKVAHFWVETEKTRDADTFGPARYEYRYKRIGAASHKVGPKEGRVPDTAPPRATACRGTVSVAYLGKDIPEDSLPYDLELIDADAPVPVEVAEDRALSAIYVSPLYPGSC